MSRTIDPRPRDASRLARAALRRLGAHPEPREPARLDLHGRRALCIATNHGALDVGVPTGEFASELSVPYFAFRDAGMQVDVASCRSGLVPVEPLSLKPGLRTRDDDGLLGDRELRAQLVDSLCAREFDFLRYDLVFLAGGGRERTAAIMHDVQDYHISPEEAADLANQARAGHLAFYHLLPAPDGWLPRRLFARGVNAVRPSDWSIADDGTLYSLPLGSREVTLDRIDG